MVVPNSPLPFHPKHPLAGTKDWALDRHIVRRPGCTTSRTVMQQKDFIQKAHLSLGQCILSPTEKETASIHGLCKCLHLKPLF